MDVLGAGDSAWLRQVESSVHRSYDCTNPYWNNFTWRSVRCRRCASCLAHRAKVWFVRTNWEIQYAHLVGGRAWFVTLTFKERFIRSASPEALYQWVQRWLKRVRKSYSTPVRYVAVLEAGSKGGRLHYHLIVCGGSGLKQRHLRSQWRSGISQAKLIDQSSTRRVAGYVSGYVAKDAVTIHASSKWGDSRGEPYLHSGAIKAPKIKIPF